MTKVKAVSNSLGFILSTDIPMVRSTRSTSNTPELFSWGIQENKNQDNISNYTFSFVMYDRNAGVSIEQQNI